MQWYYFVIIAVCLVFSAFFSAADMVYSVVNHERLEQAANEGNKRAKLAYKMVTDYNFSISTILFGNNLVNIFASSFTTLIGLALNSENFNNGELVATIVLTVIIIIFCEFFPKAIAKRYNYALALAFAYPVRVVQIIFFIIVWPISKLFSLITKAFSKKSEEEKKIDEDVLNEMIDTIQEEGKIEDKEAEILKSAVDLNDIQAFEILTPRVDVFAIDINDDINELIKDKEFFNHTRIPVYEDTIDDIIGILNVKTLAPHILKGEPINLRKLIYQPITVPRNKQILPLLEEFKETKVHIAVVIDEYGGTEGIITMEDILEEIVGDIFDENDVVTEDFVDRGKGVYYVSGSMNLEDVFEKIGYTEAEEEVETDYTTIGGYCQEFLEDFAKVGDSFDFAHYHVTIVKADEFTVEKLRIEDLTFEENKEEDD